MTDKPLHVRVAEALGWTYLHHLSNADHPCGDITLPDPGNMRWKGRDPASMLVGPQAHETYVPRYDTDWSATGPLIERFGLMLFQSEREIGETGKYEPVWVASHRFGGGYGSDWIDDVIYDPTDGDTPLIAVCNLILALAEAGRLPR